MGNGMGRKLAEILLNVNSEIRRVLYDRLSSEMPVSPRASKVKKELNLLKTELSEVISSAHADMRKEAEDQFKGLIRKVSAIEFSDLRKTVPSVVELGALKAKDVVDVMALVNEIPVLGVPVKHWFETINEKDLSRVWFTLLQGIWMGKTTPDIVRSVVGTDRLRYKDGVRSVTVRGVKMMARTMTNHISSVSSQAVWSKNADILRGVQWVSTLDQRTSPVCRDRDGKVGPVDVAAMPEFKLPLGTRRLVPPLARPPAHMNCRSTTTPIVKSWRDLGIDKDDLSAGTRASMDGNVSSELTYYQWLKRQPVSVQKEVLGPARYKLMREGVNPDRFVNDDGMVLTLDQLS